MRATVELEQAISEAARAGGLTNLAAWHNGTHWVVSTQRHHRACEITHGDDLVETIRRALAVSDLKNDEDIFA